MKNWRRIFAVLCLGLILIGTAACSGGMSGNKGNTHKVGVSMPDTDTKRWIRDGINIKAQLEALGYTVELYNAEGDPTVQVSQIEKMINNGAECLVITPIDSSALLPTLKRAKQRKIPIISYDRLIMDSDSVKYYASFDNQEVGRLIGRFVEKKLNLAERTEPANVEFFAGAATDNNAYFFNAGIFEILEPYIKSGQLRIPSGQKEFDIITTPEWSTEYARTRMKSLIAAYYSKGRKLDAVVPASDILTHGIVAALDESGYIPGDNWPIVTGQDFDRTAIKDIRSGKQSQTIFKDTRILAAKCANMVQALLEGKEPEINDTTSYDNHKLVVPSYLCKPVSVDKDNLDKIYAESGYSVSQQK